jgi:hypothetical protein|tara:strand:- start:742 stop:879 length:138 start_codon:yes stop_codon:yes gene_type:complete
MPQELVDHINAKHRRNTQAQIVIGLLMGLLLVATVAWVMFELGAM